MFRLAMQNFSLCVSSPATGWTRALELCGVSSAQDTVGRKSIQAYGITEGTTLVLLCNKLEAQLPFIAAEEVDLIL
jgi:hypothetical protein